MIVVLILDSCADCDQTEVVFEQAVIRSCLDWKSGDLVRRYVWRQGLEGVLWKIVWRREGRMEAARELGS